MFVVGLIVLNCQQLLAHETVFVQYQSAGKTISYKGIRDNTGYHFNLTSNQKITLATLDWEPYIGESLCNKGWIFQYTVAILVSKGYQVNIEFYPWARAVKLVESGQRDILFPEYFIEPSAPSDVFVGKKRRDLLVLSNRFPGGEIGFMQRADSKKSFSGDLHQLIGEKIGVVRGYQNTPEFDQMMDQGLFQIITAVNDLQLIRLLTAKRVDWIIGDPKVFHHAIQSSSLTDKLQAAMLANIKQVKPVLQYKYLYYALSRKTHKLQQVLRDINQAIGEFEKQGITQYMINQASRCAKAEF